MLIEPRPRYDEEVHLVSQILERADRTPRPNALLPITWGMVGTVADLGYFWYYFLYYNPVYAAHGRPPTAILWIPDLALAAGLAITVTRAIVRHPERRTLVDRAIGINFSVAAAIGIGLAFVGGFVGFPSWVMSGPDYAILWNLLIASAAASIGLQYHARPLLIGAIALAGSVVATKLNFFYVDLILAVGMFAGLVLPGAFYAFRGRRV